MDTATKLREKLVTKKVNLEVQIARRSEQLSWKEADKKKNEEELKDEKEYKASIKPDCDWMLKAFAGRAEKRAAELEGPTGAKEYLVGAKPSLLERRAFDDNRLSGLKFLALQKH